MKIKGLYNNYRMFNRMSSKGRHVILYIDIKTKESWINEYTDKFSYTDYQSNDIYPIIPYLYNKHHVIIDNYQQLKNAINSIWEEG